MFSSLFAFATNLTDVRQARADDTAEEASSSDPASMGLPTTPEEAEQWLDEHLPRWSVYLTGFTDDRRGPYCDPGNPLAMDAFCVLVAQRLDESGMPSGEPIRFSALRLRDSAGRYLLELIQENHLTITDVVAIQAAIQEGLERGGLDVSVDTTDATLVGQKALIDSGLATPQGGSKPIGPQREPFEGPIGPPPPPGWVESPDTHTYGPGGTTGASWPWPSPPSPRGPGWVTRPPVGRPPVQPPRTRVKEWWVEDGKLRSPNGDPAGFSKRDVLNGLEPWDIPNKTDEPITGKEMEVYKCHGQVVLGYKENCPVDYELSAPERMLQSLSTLWEEMRSSPFCSETCQAIGLAPAIMAGLCSAVTIFPVPTPLVVAGKATCAALGMSQAWQIQAVLFAGTTSGAIGSISACKRICTTKE